MDEVADALGALGVFGSVDAHGARGQMEVKT